MLQNRSKIQFNEPGDKTQWQAMKREQQDVQCPDTTCLPYCILSNLTPILSRLRHNSPWAIVAGNFERLGAWVMMAGGIKEAWSLDDTG